MFHTVIFVTVDEFGTSYAAVLLFGSLVVKRMRHVLRIVVNGYRLKYLQRKEIE